MRSLKSIDHPQANGRRPGGNEWEWLVPLRLEDGAPLELRIGRESRRAVLAALEENPEGEGSASGEGCLVVADSGGPVMRVEMIKHQSPDGEMAICSWRADDGHLKCGLFPTGALNRLTPFRPKGH